jgi:prepilin-type N-terminal cleavage/methylation domain-containing protein
MVFMNENTSPVEGDAFTLVELLTVITIISILTGLILGTAGYVHRKAASSRSLTEISAMAVACESY